MSISSTGLYGSATIVNTDIFDDVQAWKEQVTTLSTFFLTTKYVYIYTLPHSSSLLPSLSRVRSLSPPLSLSSPLSLFLSLFPSTYFLLIRYVKMEKETLNRCAHPNVVHLFCTFQVYSTQLNQPKWEWECVPRMHIVFVWECAPRLHISGFFCLWKSINSNCEKDSVEHCYSENREQRANDVAVWTELNQTKHG